MIIDSNDSIYLRKITVEDTEQVLSWRNSKLVKQYFLIQDEIKKEDHLKWLKTKVETGKVEQFIIVEKSSERPIGSVYLQDIDRLHKKAEYGIFIGESNLQGKGYGTLAADMMLTYAFDTLGLHRVYLRVLETNQRAIRSYSKAGFIKEARLVDDVYINGEYHNIVIMGVINREEKL